MDIDSDFHNLNIKASNEGGASMQVESKDSSSTQVMCSLLLPLCIAILNILFISLFADCILSISFSYVLFAMRLRIFNIEFRVSLHWLQITESSIIYSLKIVVFGAPHLFCYLL